MRVTNWYQEHTLSQLLQAESAYPTVVIVTNDHQNPSSDPAKKDLGKSTWFQFMSCTKTRAPWEDNLTSLYSVPFYAPPTRKVCVYVRSLKLTYLYLFFCWILLFISFLVKSPSLKHLEHYLPWGFFFGGASHSRLLSFSAVSDARNFIGYLASTFLPRRSAFYLIHMSNLPKPTPRFQRGMS